MKFPGGGNMQQLMQQAQRMQAEMKELQEELEQRELEYESAGGRIKIRITGKQEVLALEIAPEVIDPEDPAMTSDLIKVAVNEAIQKSQKMVADEMGKIVPPGMAGLF